MLQRAAGGFTPLYRTGGEFAAELSNDTVHGVVHIGHLAVYVKPRGRLGEAYVNLIQPFRHLVVYPALMRQIGRAWEARDITGTRSVHDTQSR